MGSKTENPVAMQLLVDVLTGQLGDDKWHKTASKIVRTFVCGNSLSLDTQDKEIEKKVRTLRRNHVALHLIYIHFK